MQFQLVLRNFENDLSFEREKDDNYADDPSITIITTKRDTAEIENLKANIKELESELHFEKSRNMSLVDLLEEEKR